MIDVKGRQCSDFLAFHADKLQAGQRTRARRDDDALADGERVPAARPVREVLRPGSGSRSSRSSATRSAATTRSRSPARRSTTRTWATSATSTARRTSTGSCSRTRSRRARAGRRSTSSSTPASTPTTCSSSDEPWSRPGDYVLLRAMTDLVCLSSACPDDIDPANAWNPTEVHVRVYPAKERFSAAIAHRVTPDAEPKLTKETGVPAAHGRADAAASPSTTATGCRPRTTTSAPSTSTGRAARRRRSWISRRCASGRSSGPDAEELLQATMTRDIRRLADGQVVYTALCNDTGGMIDDGTVFRIAPTNFRFVGGSEYDGIWLREQARAARPARLDQGRRRTSCTTSPCRARRAATC